MQEEIVEKDVAFTLIGADGGVYNPLYPRDICLPPGESVNCHCICQSVVNENVLGLSLEERQQLQREIVEADNEERKRELDAKNKAKAGIDDEKTLTNPANRGIIGTGGDVVQHLRVDTGGLRNENPLTEQQIDEAIDFAVTLGMPRDRIAYGNNYFTGYNPDYDILLLGTDLYPMENVPLDARSANARVSWKSAIGHELIGHREASLKDWTQINNAYEEAQASIRAARFTPDLTATERITLIRDGVSRLPDGIKINDMKDILYISER